jgi:DNA invertase Pin-like site-specific DNA recombinase
MNKKSIVYCRVSSKEQEETGYSLESQEKLLKDYTLSKQHELLETFKISESASGKQVRTKYLSMLEYANANNVDVLVCEKIDRLVRNPKDAVLINEWVKEKETREVHFIKESFILTHKTKAHDNFIWNMKIAVATFYTDNLSEEVKKGQEEKLSQGWLPTKPPIGYKTIGDKGKKIHIIDPETAPFIKKAFILYGSGNHSMSSVIEELFKDGFRTRSGRKPVKSRIEDMLKDEFYYGHMRWNGILYKGNHEPIITKEMFDKVQDVRLGRKSPHYKSHEYLFRKMFKCGECEGTITAQIQRGIVYYNCTHYRNCSQKKYTPEKEIEQQLMNVFEFFESITPTEAEGIKEVIRNEHAQEIQYKEHAIKCFNEQYNRLQRRLDTLYNDRLDEKITSEFWQIKQNEITTEQESIQKDLAKLKTQEAKYFEIWLNIIDLAFRARDIYEKRSPKEKRLLLRHIFSNMTLTDKKALCTKKKAVEVLAKRVQQRLDEKMTFEHENILANKRQKDSFESLSPSLLRG